MLEVYTAVDVETPNRNNDSICSIGVVHMEYGTPVYKREFLVQPEEHFDHFNVRIHGIKPRMVKDAPIFPEVWDEIAHFFDGVVVAHNAPFDLGAIAKMLCRYGIDMPEVSYACSLRKARRHLPKEVCGSHKLDDLSRGLNIPLERHHDALDDALASALIMEWLIDRFGCDCEDVTPFNCTGLSASVTEQERGAALHALGELSVQAGGGRICARHHEKLEDWARHYDKYLRDREFREWFLFVQRLLLSGEITPEQQQSMEALSALPELKPKRARKRRVVKRRKA